MPPPFLQRHQRSPSEGPAVTGKKPPKEKETCEKMNRGSKTALSTVSTVAHLSGVSVSLRPRKTPFVTNQSVSGGAPGLAPEGMRLLTKHRVFHADAHATNDTLMETKRFVLYPPDRQ